MKKIILSLLLVTSAYLCFAQTSREDWILQASYAGLRYKTACKYAELKVKSESGEELTEKELKKLFELNAKIDSGAQKMATYEQTDETAAASKKAKISKKVTKSIERSNAINAYEEYIYKNKTDEQIPINPKTGFPEILSKPFVVFDEGITFDMVTRLQKQDSFNRSNFVWQDYLLGAYFDITSVNLKPFNDMIRFSVYYPFYHTFCGMEQVPKQTVLYAFDIYAGPVFQFDMWDYVYINLSGGIHYMYQLSDEYHLNYLGMGLLGGIELPVARRWTVVNNGTFTLDYANLGTNKRMQPFDYSWSYQISLGVRYSKKKLHKYAYIHHMDRSKKEKTASASTEE